ncbi:amidase [Naasia aerilata]|uniref:Amidase family protein n=1 Tax=Naasia aerilata TaxID=1162966 RepID=A0ABM8GCV2_9MICO|nr:amidase [Naasia aerilata]BDZ46078.1 amidase family protein [Naasia aerilata]
MADGNGDDLTWMTATEIAERVRGGRLSAGDVAEHFLERIARLNPALNAFVHHDPAEVRRRAATIDAAVRSGEDPGPLAGVPYSLKESTAARGLPHTGAMAAMRGHVADFDAVVTRRLRTAGGLLMGKTNLPENGYRCGTDGHLYGVTRNPWNLDASPGGSSGGAAASVAAGLTPLADGSDGAGSIRVPGAMCGLVGFKPSTGRIPQQLLPTRFATFLSHGILARSVPDVALMLNVEAGPDAADPLSLPRDNIDYVRALTDEGDDAGRPLRGWRIAWSPDLGIGGDTDPEVLDLCQSAVSAFEELGATVVTAAPPWPNPEESMWDSVWLPAYAPDLDAYDWDALRRDGEVDEELYEIVAAGAAASGSRTAAADMVRAGVYRAFAAFLSEHDLLVSPTVRVPGYPAGRFGPAHLDGEPLRRRILGWINTYPFNMTGTPAITVPVGLTSAGLPVGLQLAGGHLEDARVLRAAARFESARPWRHRPPFS